MSKKRKKVKIRYKCAVSAGEAQKVVDEIFDYIFKKVEEENEEILDLGHIKV